MLNSVCLDAKRMHWNLLIKNSQRGLHYCLDLHELHSATLDSTQSVEDSETLPDLQMPKMLVVVALLRMCLKQRLQRKGTVLIAAQ